MRQVLVVLAAVLLSAALIGVGRHEVHERRAEAQEAHLRCVRAAQEQIARAYTEATNGGTGAATGAALYRRSADLIC